MSLAKVRGWIDRYPPPRILLGPISHIFNLNYFTSAWRPPLILLGAISHILIFIILLQPEPSPPHLLMGTVNKKTVQDSLNMFGI